MYTLKSYILTLVISTCALFVPKISSVDVTIPDFYPFGTAHGDFESQDEEPGPISIQTAFPYFNKSHTKIYANINGAISFEQGSFNFSTLCGDPYSHKALIAPFWIQKSSRKGGKMYYRESTNQTLLNITKTAITKGFSRLPSISLKWLFLVTWIEVGSNGRGNCSDSTNKFQLILTTDGNSSFAILLYKNVNYIGCGASNCKCFGSTFSEAGFGVGEGSTFHRISRSGCSTKIENILNGYNLQQPGKWAFQIDSVFEPAALGPPPIYKKWKLRVTPSFVSIMGHVSLNISGQCFHTDRLDAVCRFYDPVLPKPIIVPADVDIKEAKCTVPYLHSFGQLKVELAYFNPDDIEEIHSMFIYVVEPKFEVEFNINSSANTSIVNLSWNPTILRRIGILDVILVVVNGEEWTDTVLAKNIPNTGSYSGEISETTNWNTSMAAVRLVPTAGGTTKFRAKRSVSRRIPGSSPNSFGQFTCATHKKFSKTSAEAQCDKWFKSDPGVSMEGVKPCPPTVALTQVDPDFGQGGLWSNFFPSNNRGGTTYYRQTNPGPTGSRQQCVYESSGNIIENGPNRGTVDAASTFRAHISRDVVPTCVCCKLSNKCDQFLTKRPGGSSEGYKPPAPPATATGDPHFRTFDGLYYVFNGAGEFWMIRDEARNFSMQSRMEPFGSASLCTAFAMHDGATAVQIGRHNVTKKPELHFNGEYVPIPDEPSDIELPFPNGTIIRRASQFEFDVKFSAGYAFRFSIGWWSINLVASLDTSSSSRKINGLLGYMDNDSTNDLKAGSGTVIPWNSPSERIHYDFGLTWAVKSNESIFVNSNFKGFSSYNKKDFKPTFFGSGRRDPQEGIVTQSSVSRQTGNNICGNNPECLFDLASTNNTQIANETRQQVENIKRLLAVLRKVIYKCSSIKESPNMKIEFTNTLVGSVVNFTCDPGFKLIGSNSTKCESRHKDGRDPQWSMLTPVCLLKPNWRSYKVALNLSVGDSAGASNSQNILDPNFNTLIYGFSMYPHFTPIPSENISMSSFPPVWTYFGTLEGKGGTKFGPSIAIEVLYYETEKEVSPQQIELVIWDEESKYSHINEGLDFRLVDLVESIRKRNTLERRIPGCCVYRIHGHLIEIEQ